MRISDWSSDVCSSDLAEPAKAVERHWVQIASGRNKDDMPREWARLKAKAAAVLSRRTPYVAAASGTHRLLNGSFAILSVARDVLNRLIGVGLRTYPRPSHEARNGYVKGKSESGRLNPG